jgi:predicted RNase H-like HicB family nuclease
MRAKIELNVVFEPTEKGDFIGYIEELPSLKGKGTTIEEVQNNLQKSLHLLWELLGVVSLQWSKQTIDEIKSLLVAYYAQKVDEEIDALWEAKGMNEQTMQDLLSTQLGIEN